MNMYIKFDQVRFAFATSFALGFSTLTLNRPGPELDNALQYCNDPVNEIHFEILKCLPKITLLTGP